MQTKFYGLFFLVFFSSITRAVEITRLNGSWKNQRGSTLVLRADPSGSLSGNMRTTVGSQDVVASKNGFPLAGFINGSSLGFVICWSLGSGSVTTFSGELKTPDELDSSKDQIVTFTLTKMGLNAEEKWRNTVLTEDTFVRVVGSAQKIH